VDADNVRVLFSDDGGESFDFLAFNAPGAVDAFAYPNVTPGMLNDCTGGGIRNTLVAGADQGGGRFGLPRFKQATRLISQPHAAAAHGAFLFVLNGSTSRSSATRRRARRSTSSFRPTAGRPGRRPLEWWPRPPPTRSTCIPQCRFRATRRS
jgi:hypothetical protein